MKIKCFFKVLTIALISTILFASCGGDARSTPIDPNMPTTVDESKTYKYTLLMIAGSKSVIPKEINIKDFKKLGKYTDHIKEAKVRNSSKIVITGIDKGKHKLENLTLSIKNTNIKRNLGTITKDEIFNFKEDLEFSQSIMNQLTSSKKIELELITTSEKQINSDVFIELIIETQFRLR